MNETHITILCAGKIEASAAHAAMVNAINVHRIDARAQVELICDPLGTQIRNVEVDRNWPQPTIAGGGEMAVIRRGGHRYTTRTIAGVDLKLNRTSLQRLLGDVNVLALHWRHLAALGIQGVLARAYWLQQRLGMSAGDSLLEALREIYCISEEQLKKDRPKFYARTSSLGDARFDIQLAEVAPALRYPLVGVSEREAAPLYRDLEDLVGSECNKVAPELHLLTDVLKHSSAPLIVQIEGSEELPFCPGLSIDSVKLSQSVVTPRPNVTYLAEPLVHLRLTNDGDSIDDIEGFSVRAGEDLWNAVTTARSVNSLLSDDVVGRWQPSRGAASIAAVALPTALVVGACMGWFTMALATIGTLIATGCEVYLIGRMLSRKSLTVMARPQPEATVPALATAPQATNATPQSKGESVEMPQAILDRMKPATNGSHV